jgi:hypothetical protein
MRRLILFALGSTIALTLIPSASGVERAREVSRPYDLASGVRLPDSEVHWSLPAVTTGARFRAQPGETSVTIEIEDRLGGVAIAHVHIDRNGDGRLDVDKDACGTKPARFSITAQSRIEVYPVAGVCPDGTPALVTQGRIHATFH